MTSRLPTHFFNAGFLFGFILLVISGCRPAGPLLPTAGMSPVEVTIVLMPETGSPEPELAAESESSPSETEINHPLSEEEGISLAVTPTVAAVSTPEPTRKSAMLLTQLGRDQGNIPSLDSDATRSPTPAPSPTILPATPLTVEISGSDFAELVGPSPLHDFVKIGFHVGPGGHTAGLSEWMETLDAAGIPFFLKSVDNAGPLLEAQRLRAASGVPHVLVYRRHGGEFELPDYTLNPIQAAREHWARHREAFPPELDPQIVWLETINEVDKNRAGWLGLFALETARLAVRDGYKWAAFGWSAGEPEISHWTQPSMVNFLKFAAAHPDQVAVALHEYSYEAANLLRQSPHLVGRFQQLFWVCDELGIGRPTVLITEFGWEYRRVPEPADALPQLRQAALLYGSFEEVKGAAIWYLGPGYGTIDHMTQRLIAPVTQYALTHYFHHGGKTAVNPLDFD